MTRKKTRFEYIADFVAACPEGEDVILYVNDQLEQRGRAELSSNEMRRISGGNYAVSSKARIKGEDGGDEEAERGKEEAASGSEENGPTGFALVASGEENSGPVMPVVGNRYAMDEYASKNIYESGRRATMRLHALLTNDALWDQLKPREQLSAVNMALDRAYGRNETVTAEQKLNGDSVDDGVAGLLPQALADVAKDILLPEMKKHKPAEKK